MRQLRLDIGVRNTFFIHLTLVPWLKTAGEIKTKPTQHSVRDLRSIGLQPDVLICRSAEALTEDVRSKIALFTSVEERAVISLPDAPPIYQVPVMLNEQSLDDIVIEKLGRDCASANLSEWRRVTDALELQAPATVRAHLPTLHRLSPLWPTAACLPTRRPAASRRCRPRDSVGCRYARP